MLTIMPKPTLQGLYRALQPSVGAYAYLICAGGKMLPLVIRAELSYRMIELSGIRCGQLITEHICRGPIAGTHVLPDESGRA